MRKLISIILVCVLAAGMAVSMVGCGSEKTLQINLNDFIDFEFSGANGEGTVEYSFDNATFRDKYENDIVMNDNEDFEQSDITLFLSYMSSCGSFSKDEGLSNGDSVKFSWDLNKTELEDRFNVSLSFEDIDLTVEGLNNQYIDILNFTCDRDGEVLHLSAGEEILFTAKIETNIDVSDSVMLIMSNNDDEFLWFAMNDNGTDGDETAGDNIYSICLINAIATPGNRIFYMDVNGIQSDTVVNIMFTDDQNNN